MGTSYEEVGEEGAPAPPPHNLFGWAMVLSALQGSPRRLLSLGGSHFEEEGWGQASGQSPLGFW